MAEVFETNNFEEFSEDIDNTVYNTDEDPDDEDEFDGEEDEDNEGFDEDGWDEDYEEDSEDPEDDLDDDSEGDEDYEDDSEEDDSEDSEEDDDFDEEDDSEDSEEDFVGSDAEEYVEEGTDEDSEDDSASETEEQEGYRQGSAVEQMSPDMQAEYDNTMSGEARVSNLLRLTGDKFTRVNATIDLADIGIPEAKKIGRSSTLAGLTRSVREMGVVDPIHVMAVENATAGFRYILIDGLRRIFAARKNNISVIDAVVWHFKDYDRGMELLLDLSLILNRGQKRTWKEIWGLYELLEMQSAVTPGTLEYLLQMESGDAMKLKDVMLCNYSEVKEALMSGEKDLDGAYKMLQKLRKEEDAIARDDMTGVSNTVEGAEELVTEDSGTRPELSDQDVLELLEMADSIDDEDDDDLSFASMNQADSSFVDQQTVGDRHPLDPALRQAVLARDDFICYCCGMRMIGARLGLVAVHHILPVHTGGKDTMDNLTTLCVGCHIALHVMERNGGSIMMSEEDFKTLLPNERNSLKRALKLARVAIEADKRKGLSKSQVAEATRGTMKHPMPGVGLKETQAMFNATMNAARSNNEDS